MVQRRLWIQRGWPKVLVLYLLAQVMWLAAMVGTSSAKDTVRVVRGGDRRVTEIAGKVLEFDRDTLTIKVAQQKTKVIPHAAVLSVDTRLVTSHESGRQKIEQGDWDGAIKSLGLAYQREQRDWVRQQVLRDLALAHRFAGDIERSAATALALYRDYPRTNQQDALPLNWINGESGPRRAAAWLRSDDGATQLLGASWSLSGGSRAPAITVLRRLSSESDQWIAQLATAQLWRTELATVTTVKCERWARLVNRMPPVLRAGPLFVLGTAWERVGDQNRAAVALMQVPVLHSDAKNLSVNALMKTASLAGVAEKVAAYREVIRRYPFTTQAPLAQQELNRLQKKAKDG